MKTIRSAAVAALIALFSVLALAVAGTAHADPTDKDSARDTKTAPTPAIWPGAGGSLYAPDLSTAKDATTTFTLDIDGKNLSVGQLKPGENGQEFSETISGYRSSGVRSAHLGSDEVSADDLANKDLATDAAKLNALYDAKVKEFGENQKQKAWNYVLAVLVQQKLEGSDYEKLSADQILTLGPNDGKAPLADDILTDETKAKEFYASQLPVRKAIRDLVNDNLVKLADKSDGLAKFDIAVKVVQKDGSTTYEYK